MIIFQAPYYTNTQLQELELNEISFPFSDSDARYDGKSHQYELTENYFTERGINIKAKLNTNKPDDVKHFLEYVRAKFYLYVYSHSKSTKPQLDYLIAKRGLRTYPNLFEYRSAVLDAMFRCGVYLLDNGDLGQLSGVNMSDFTMLDINTLRNEDRDYPKDFKTLMSNLGLCYYGCYKFIVSGMGKEW